MKSIAAKLSDFFNVPVVPGETLLFLDEIQKSEDVIHSLWFFKEDYPKLHVIAAGSLLEFALKDLASFGVGRVSSLFVYPMSFDEFLMAMGQEGLLRTKRNSSPTNPLPRHSITDWWRLFEVICWLAECQKPWQPTRRQGLIAIAVIL